MSKDDLLRKLVAEVEADLMHVAITNTTQASETTIDWPKMLRELEQTLRNLRRTNITFVVDIAHPGPPIRHETPNDGTRIELSWLQANEIHQHWPLKLVKIVAPGAGEYVPITPFGYEIVPKILPQPFEDQPDEET
jgi:hypothetical protein